MNTNVLDPPSPSLAKPARTAGEIGADAAARYLEAHVSPFHTQRKVITGNNSTATVFLALGAGFFLGRRLLPGRNR
jgi:hypothetical protein